MSHNTFGHLFRVTTFGESHGPAIGCVVDGCPPGVPLPTETIQAALDRRRPGTSRFVTQRQEADAVRVLSGVFEDERTDGPRTTGTPIALLIENTDQRSRDYAEIRDTYRPGHADYAYDAKYGLRDYRGGGRSSARETACRVAAGAVASAVLDHLYDGAVRIRGGLVAMGPHEIDRSRVDWDTAADNPFWCPDPLAAQDWEGLLDSARKSGDSLGALIEITASGLPAGLGAPVYGKLDAELAGALMSINAAKGVEIGEGMAAARLSGTANADEMRSGDGGPSFLSNHAGGVMGGISTGQDLVARVAIKPTSSILTPRRTVKADGTETEVVTKGRHDPCVGIRGVPVAEAMVACVLADQALRHRAQTGRLGAAG
ncbi:chorismate synthase [Parvularcula dongshanensis]|uniref:Chorismate synthase n=1 Tax=Parvularcula dongshanensis TaxID=1173995 RepID=A0A840I6X2_9PROT|nr:chorismate synthase [Parvularcula dongshanensis]MBB4659740.1 chorismate synthase [Parvularcula dongshanensis]